MAGEWIGRDPPSEVITQMCDAIQRSWTEQERERRAGRVEVDGVSWTVPQYLVHHCETGRWTKGKERKALVWRRVDGR